MNVPEFSFLRLVPLGEVRQCFLVRVNSLGSVAIHHKDENNTECHHFITLLLDKSFHVNVHVPSLQIIVGHDCHSIFYCFVYISAAEQAFLSLKLIIVNHSSILLFHTSIGNRMNAAAVNS